MTTPPHIPRFTLERLAAKELSPTEEADVLAHVKTCAECRQARTELGGDEVSFRAEVPYGTFRIEHERRLAARTPAPVWRRLLVPALAAATVTATALLVVLVPQPAEHESSTRTKGDGVALTFMVTEQGVARPGTNNDRVARGATIQLSYDAGSLRYLAVLGIDEHREVVVYYPEIGDAQAPVPAGPRGALPFGLTLDTRVGRERFVAVFADTPLSLSFLKESLAQAGIDHDLALPRGVAQSTVRVEKR